MIEKRFVKLIAAGYVIVRHLEIDLSGTKIGRNEPCWCNSGKKYKNCHLNRSDEKRLPFDALKDGVIKNRKISKCLHPEASETECNNIISAHTIQRSRVLKEISDKENHIMAFNSFDPANKTELNVHRIGWKKASTFTAFCGHHDEVTFMPLEKKPFIGNKEQIFLIAYRAICWELFQKESVIKASPSIKENIDRGLSEDKQKMLQRIINIQSAGQAKGFEDLTKAKSEMDKALLTKCYDDYNTYEIKLEGNLEIASTGAITPSVSLSGKTLQALHNLQAVVQWIAFGIDISEDKHPSIVFLWSKNNLASQKFMDEIELLDDQKLTEYLIQFFFAYCENTYFSIAWWSSLSDLQKKHITQLMMNTNPYYYFPKYNYDLSLSPWSVISRIKK